MTARYDFSTKEGKNQYQRDYYHSNVMQKEKQLLRAKRNSRNRRNKEKCKNLNTCVIKLSEGINKESCIGCVHYIGRK